MIEGFKADTVASDAATINFQRGGIGPLGLEAFP